MAAAGEAAVVMAELRMIEPLSPELRAYYAGVFDAKGSVSANRHRYRQSRTVHLTLTISHREPDLLQVLQRLFGGSLVVRDPRNTWLWTVTGRRVEPFIDAIRPYTRYRGLHLDIAARFGRTYAFTHAGIAIPPAVARERERLRKDLCDANTHVRDWTARQRLARARSTAAGERAQRASRAHG